MNILVTGGAGYVGSVVAEQLVHEKNRVIILDNLRHGYKEAVDPEAEFVLADVGNIDALENVFRRFPIDAVIHMAAETVVEDSLIDPGKYFQTNIVAGLNLLDVMLKHDVRKCIFSSSAAVYGEPESVPIEENHPKNPSNAYGDSKLSFERILEWYGKAYGLKHVSLRYFNAAGATGRLGEQHNPETHLIPRVLKAAQDDDVPVSIFGRNYPTQDGSPVRDYIHVTDIARAHVMVLEKLDDLSSTVYNLGNGVGYSVLEVVAAAREITKMGIRSVVRQRRAGDPAVLVASSVRARVELNWEPQFSQLENIIESAWQWMQRHPKGYKE